MIDPHFMYHFLRGVDKEHDPNEDHVKQLIDAIDEFTTSLDISCESFEHVSDTFIYSYGLANNYYSLESGFY